MIRDKGTLKPRTRYLSLHRLARLWMAGLLCTSVSLAQALPFLGPEKDFELRFATSEGRQRLQEAIAEELLSQKQNNATLKQYSSQYKIDRFQADTIRTMLRSEGYYDSEILHRRQNDITVYNIDTGPRYTVRELRIEFPDDLPVMDKKFLTLREGAPLRAEDVLAGRSTITAWVNLNLCPYRVQVDYEAKVFHQDHTASVVYRLRPTEQVHFGEFEITGLKTIDEDYLKARLPVAEGRCFNRQRVDQSRLALLQTNLIASAEAIVGQPENGTVPVRFNVIERGHRTLRAGIGYDTVFGPGVSLGWQHRNLLGRSEKLDILLRVNEIGRSLESEFMVPHFRRENQTLVLHASTFRERPEAYDTTGGSIGAALARQVTPEFFGSLGVRYRYSEVQEDEVENNFHLLSLPTSLEYDRRNNLLNPEDGWRLALNLEPFMDLNRSDRQFLRSRITGDIYYTVRDWVGDPTFAARISTGTISGVTRREVPADLRFYVGGGGSVRGYGYQTLSELGEEDRPLGGRSFTELALETRVRFSQSWGGVVFLDGGYAYSEQLPSLGDDLRWGAGVGVRYLTDFAPIRLDVGFPLDRREGIDSSFHLYISIGQAF